MGKKYAIWNKTDDVLVPTGKLYTAEEWVKEYPVYGRDGIVPVCNAGEINGAFFDTLGQMCDVYRQMGCDFTSCETDEDKILAIEAFEDAMRTSNEEANASNEVLTDSLASIAASMEYQNMLTLEDAEG